MKKVFAAHQTLTEGSGEGNDFLGWLDLPVEQETDEICRIRAAAERIRAINRSFAGKYRILTPRGACGRGQPTVK